MRKALYNYCEYGCHGGYVGSRHRQLQTNIVKAFHREHFVFDVRYCDYDNADCAFMMMAFAHCNDSMRSWLDRGLSGYA